MRLPRPAFIAAGTLAGVAMLALGLAIAIVPLAQGRFFFYFDNAVQNYPQTVFLSRALSEGVIPHWWPEAAAGLPVVAEGQAAHFSPIRLLLVALLDPPTAFMVEIGLYLGLSGLGTYLFLRAHRVHPLAACVGAIGFMLGSPTIVLVRSMALLRASCWLPWTLWLAERYIRGRRTRDAVWAALPIGLQFLGGNPTFTVVTLVAASAYLAARSAHRSIQSGDNWRSGIVRASGAVAGAGAVALLGAGIGAIQLAPTLQHVPESVRAGGYSLEYASEVLRADPLYLPQLIFPYAYSQGDLRDNGDFNLVAVCGFYGGTLGVLAAACALGAIRQVRAVWPIAAAAVLSILIALGSLTGVFGLLWRLPLLGGLRFPSRYLLWTSFCVACLGAFGLHRVILSRAGRGPGRRLVAMGAVLTAAAGVVYAFRPAHRAGVLICLCQIVVSLGLLAWLGRARPAVRRHLMVAAVILAAADLTYFRLRSGYAPSVNIEQTLAPGGVAARLARDSSDFRLLTLVNRQDPKQGIPLKDTLQGATPVVWGLQGLGGAFSLNLKRFTGVRNEIEMHLRRRPDRAEEVAPLLGLLNTKYVIAPSQLRMPGWEKTFEQESLAVWTNPRFLPRVYLAGRLVRQPPPADGGIGGIPIPLTLVDAETAVVDAENLPELEGVRDGDTVEALTAAYDSMHFRVRAQRPAWLAISVNHYPGWTAEVNGRAAPIHRTNWLGMGLLAPAGESTVSLRFETPRWRPGLWISAASLAVWLAALALTSTRRGILGT